MITNERSDIFHANNVPAHRSLRVLVAGATGAIGRETVAALADAGHHVRALARRPELVARHPRVEAVGADVTQASTLAGICDGMDAVISLFGAPVSMRRTPREVTFESVDFRGNRNLLGQALRAGTGRYLYVSLYDVPFAEELEYVQWHEEVVRMIVASGISHTIIRPTALYAAYADLLPMARRSLMAVIGDGSARTNPVHEADVAAACVGALDGAQTEIPIGGPDILTRREIAELACTAMGTTPRIVGTPAWLFKAMTLPVRPFDPRLHAMLRFFADASTNDVVAPAVGRRRMADYFRARAAELVSGAGAPKAEASRLA